MARIKRLFLPGCFSPRVMPSSFVDEAGDRSTHIEAQQQEGTGVRIDTGSGPGFAKFMTTATWSRISTGRGVKNSGGPL
jgi:hypothetical protein